ncbi:uncharacterized protein BCR38DRAFT_482074 [Pseudomassariella vexata]|uniref:Uncharacterized protein n=1 Tax=Pseudomassariella vexata TaxID=1141098 RepID=A0A1Y2EBD6_9PEZI|nr:uncharacterized protein BCR38DRAFT_482074 [Pseudomassariella vexata]ORY68576.1 hypothetical protein BCR38DRAFT_482074 [Pseudomassariella vexata]
MALKAQKVPPAPPRPKPNPTPRTVGQLPQSLRAPPPKRVDLSSPAYKQASKKYVNFMIAMPILLVTSYFLFDRLIVGNEAKTLHKLPTDGHCIEHSEA